VPRIVVYCTSVCPYCTRALKLLDGKGVEYETVRVDLAPERRVEMEARSGRTSVPQIFIEDFHVGGFDDLSELDLDDELDPLLGLD
jgi:glutaredoxin 3